MNNAPRAFTTFPKPPKNPVEKPIIKEGELINQIAVIECVLGKLKARQEAANDAHKNDYQHPHTAADLIDWSRGTVEERLWPSPEGRIFSKPTPEQKIKKKLLKGLPKAQADKIISLGLRTYESEAIYLLDKMPKGEQQLIADGIIYGSDILAHKQYIYKYCIYFPEYGKSLFTFLGKAFAFESDLDGKITEAFSERTDVTKIENRVRELYRKQVGEALQRSTDAVDKLHDEATDVDEEHGVYEDAMLEAYLGEGRYRDVDETEIPEEVRVAVRRIKHHGDGSIDIPLQEKHAAIFKKIDAEIEKLSESLSSINLSTLLFLSAFKSLKENKIPFSFEDVTSMRFSYVNSSDIEDKEAIRNLYKKCHAKDATDYLDSLLKSNDEKLADPNSNFYLLKYKDQLEGMIRFDETRNPDGKLIGLYAGGLIVDPEFGGSRIADSIIEQTFAAQRARGVPIDAFVKIDSPLALRYLSGDFICDKIESLGGVERLHIILEPSNDLKPLTKELSEDEIVQKAGTRTANQSFTSFDTLPHAKDIPIGFNMTRLIKRDGKYYAAFERLASAGEAIAA